MKYKAVLAAMAALMFQACPVHAARLMENLDPGVVAVKITGGVYVGWRMLGTEPASISFNVYRGGVKVNSSPITASTNYIDSAGTTSSTYSVSAIIDGVEQAQSVPVGVWGTNYLTVSLSRPEGGTTPDGVSYTYSPNDCSAGDLDGDGQYEIVLKWDPSNSKDNSQAGYTGNVYLDGYELDGTHLWRIDLGRNIRAGAHYTQFMVYDLDSDGKAEVVCKTADATIDGTGVVIGSLYADYRNAAGYILDGPEYLTVFNGETGAAMDTVNYEPPRGDVSNWGDSYGNRVDRFLACVAYLDGQRPSVVMCRGYYTRAVLVAWNWRAGELSKVWTFDSFAAGNYAYSGQGNHNLSVGDVDGDGKDEIVYGSCCIDHDGRGLWSSGLGHGDAMHMSNLNPDRAGLEVWGIHEGTDTPGSALLDGRTGEVIWKTANADVGRGVAADIASNYRGAECWGGTSGLRSITNVRAGSTPSSTNFVIWWDGDLQRELLDGNVISKYGGSTLLTASGCSSNNGTKSTPCLSADILGDWREEVIFRTTDDTAIRIYTTTTSTNYRLFTLMHEPQYRLAISWQNVAYNQPPHPSFYLGDGPGAVPVPDIVYPGADLGPIQPDPMTWASVPAATGLYSITMTAQEVTAGALDAQYYFECVWGDGHDSGWQAGRTYVDSGLDVNTTYGYTVKAREWANHAKVTAPSEAAFASTLPMPGPVVAEAHWPLNETHGVSFVDVSANWNDGAVDGVTGDDAAWAEGRYGNCLTFEIGGGRAVVPASQTLDFGNESMTVAFWLKEPTSIVAGTKHEILVKGTFGWPIDSGNGKRYEFRRTKQDGASDLLQWIISDGTTTTAMSIASVFACTGDWTCVVGVRDKANNQLRLYVDGILRAAGYDGSTNISNSEPLYMGESGMIGAIDDVRIYREALSFEEVTAFFLGEWNIDNSAPTPSPMTFVTAPTAVDTGRVTMVATPGRDESGVEYYFACTSGGGHDSGWQDEVEYTDANLANNAAYAYRVIARDKSPQQNETQWSEEASAKTLRYECSESSGSDLDGDCEIDFHDYAMLAAGWGFAGPNDPVVNGSFGSDISGWLSRSMEYAPGAMTSSFDGAEGDPAGSARLETDTTVTDIDGHYFYQIVPVTNGKQYKLTGEWKGNLTGVVPSTPGAMNWVFLFVGFTDNDPFADSSIWETLAYAKAYGDPNVNIGPAGTWDWELLTSSHYEGPVDGIFTATADHAVIMFGLGGTSGSGTSFVNIDNVGFSEAGQCAPLDLNDDCAFDFVDIQTFAAEWLSCYREPDSECWY